MSGGSSTTTRPRDARGRVRGMTLVELMVGLTLGMALSVAALRLFAEASASGKNIQRASIQIENGRYAIELLREDLQLAGFFGEIATGGAAYSAGDPCEIGASAYLANPLTLPTPVLGLPADQIVACLSQRRANTDAVLVRRLEVDATAPDMIGTTNAHPFVQYSFCESDPAITPLVVGTQTSDFTLRNRACTSPNRVRGAVARIYFVAECSRCGGGGDSTPTLKRLELVGSRLVETALVEGVETLRIEYGFDTDGDGSADVYRTTTAAAGPESLWQNVVTLKLHAIVRSPERVLGTQLASTQTFQLGGFGTVQTPNDGFVRRAYTTTVRLENPSAARERP